MLKKMKNVRQKNRPASPIRAGARAKRRKPPLDDGSLEDRIVDLATSGALDAAAQNAIRRQLARGIPVTFERDGKVIKHFPDGREEVLALVPRSKYTPPKGVAILGGK